MGNITGDPFREFVQEQVKRRQEVLGLQGDNVEAGRKLQQYTSKAPFLRLASSVNITDKGKNSVFQKLIDLGFGDREILGNSLAKKCVLQAGVVDINENGELKSGLQSSTKLHSPWLPREGVQISNKFEGAYGWGSNVFDQRGRGYVPMPGITQAKVVSQNRGALTTTNVSIKCFSKEQFAIIDALYMRPGYTVLLEFGHSQYIGNDGNSQKSDTFRTDPISQILNGQTNQWEIYKSIERERELASGNYDAVYGKINNFNWTFNKDGSYDIMLEITGMGDIIEKLKVNISPIVSKDLPKVDFGEKAANWWKEGFDNIKSGRAFNDVMKSIKYGDDYVNEYKELEQNLIVPSSFKSSIHENIWFLQRTAHVLKYIKKLNDVDKSQLGVMMIDSFRDESGKKKNVRFENAILHLNTPLGNPKTSNTYIKYGTFLALIQHNFIPHDDTTNTPLTTFDMDFLDPNLTSPDSLGNYYSGLENDENYILNIPGQLSTDPRVCLIPYRNFNIVQKSYGKNELNNQLTNTNFFPNNSNYLGRLANIMVNTDYIIKVLDSINLDEENNINLLDFLNVLNKGITSSLGGINRIDILLNKEGNKIKFVEDIPQNLFAEGTKTYSLFNVFGVQKDGIGGSFVRDINLNANLGPNFSSMIVASSQLDSNSLGSNSMSFTNYSLGLEDRVIPKKSIKGKEKIADPLSTSKKLTPEDIRKSIEKDIIEGVSQTYNITEELAETLLRLDRGINNSFSYYGEIYSKYNFNNDIIEAFKNNMSTIFESSLSILCTDGPTRQVKAPFFLPFNLQLTMDGLSGMRLFERFKINDNVLPPAYNTDDVDILIKGISHDITPEGWTTKLDTQSAPNIKNIKNKFFKPYLIPTTSNLDEKVQFEQNFPPIDGTSTDIKLPPEVLESILDGENEKAIKIAYDRIPLLLQDTKQDSMCARWTYNYAKEYTRALKGLGVSQTWSRSGGNAKQKGYYIKLGQLGYTPRYYRGISFETLENAIKSPSRPWKDGEVIAYFNNDSTGDHSSYKFGHTQIYTGDLSTSGWSSNLPNNSEGLDFVYPQVKSNNWTLVVFTRR